MKTKIITALLLGTLFVSSNALATVYVPSPPGNIVQNGNFLDGIGNWNGLIALVNNPNAPNGRFGLGGDIYQDLATIPGQQYSLVYHAAADLRFGPNASMSVELNQQTLFSFDTPPYTYNPQINRYDQMHWQEYTALFTASASSTRLESNDLTTYDFGLAAVSVVPIPEPTCVTLFFFGWVVVNVVRGKHRLLA